MSEKRVVSRRRLLKNGLIVLSEKAPKIECTVRNASETGAALQLSTTLGIPQNFDLLSDGARRRCRAAWRTDTKIGVTFK
jgi:hypothetical protein